MMKDKVEKVKAWAKAHEDDLVVWGIYATAATLYGGAMYVAYKSYNKAMTEWEQQAQELNEAASRGATVLPGPNGTWWILENQS